ncbi:DUF1642 domain-containing protein [Candidatus Enterococcus ferrettii]|uniref:DUF1642 domain-containing protein n=1 Tax=Candidatus Enterococcus ferrettii TaxID=2815324 RepID=A0ABV0EJX9_9ENTE|nr:DUF1642 domain-containing protein [Enterococcus sp. 665A]MBO1341872.1 DUF1642 domain-containing protein [Enterococcus sp. 665A]
MNVQELIAKYEQVKEDILHYQNSENWKCEGLLQKSQSVAVLSWVHDFIEDLKKIDEPQKVKVPAFVAEWYEKNKSNLEFRIWKYIKNWDDQEWNDFKSWMDKNNNKSFETLTQMQYGYEVEEEPKYYVKLPGTAWETYLVRSDENELILWQNTRTGTQFTEKEIKAIDDRYWPFAVPVEPVEVAE